MGVQTHRKHELGMGKTRLMVDLEPSDKLLCVTFGHRLQRLEARAGAEQAKVTEKSADTAILKAGLISD